MFDQVIDKVWSSVKIFRLESKGQWLSAYLSSPVWKKRMQGSVSSLWVMVSMRVLSVQPLQCKLCLLLELE